mmetsp:Transcript_8808/g.25081  ORF Transcript_8808/g.25081 Transcript_8808/m.25081 type:complete len:229 (-) Transcript_8808:1779-2465(-)
MPRPLPFLFFAAESPSDHLESLGGEAHAAGCAGEGESRVGHGVEVADYLDPMPEFHGHLGGHAARGQMVLYGSVASPEVGHVVLGESPSEQVPVPHEGEVPCDGDGHTDFLADGGEEGENFLRLKTDIGQVLAHGDPCCGSRGRHEQMPLFVFVLHLVGALRGHVVAWRHGQWQFLIRCGGSLRGWWRLVLLSSRVHGAWRSCPLRQRHWGLLLGRDRRGGPRARRSG